MTSITMIKINMQGMSKIKNAFLEFLNLNKKIKEVITEAKQINGIKIEMKNNIQT